MTAYILQDGSSQFHLDLEVGMDTNKFLVHMSEATTIMPTLPSIHNCSEDDSESDNDKDTDQQPFIHNRHEKGAESDNDEDSHNGYKKQQSLIMMRILMVLTMILIQILVMSLPQQTNK